MPPPNAGTPDDDRPTPDRPDRAERPEERRGDDDGALDVDSRWASIVADLGGDVGTAPAPVERRGHDGPRGPAGFPRAPWVGHATGPRDRPTSEEVEALEDDESHFTPPEPPPLGGRAPLLTLAWAVAVLAPVVLLVGAVLLTPMPSGLVGGAGVAFVAAVGILVWRMPHHKDPDDHDPGAVV